MKSPRELRASKRKFAKQKAKMQSGAMKASMRNARARGFGDPEKYLQGPTEHPMDAYTTSGPKETMFERLCRTMEKVWRRAEEVKARNQWREWLRAPVEEAALEFLELTGELSTVRNRMKKNVVKDESVLLSAVSTVFSPLTLLNRVSASIEPLPISPAVSNGSAVDVVEDSLENMYQFQMLTIKDAPSLWEYFIDTVKLLHKQVRSTRFRRWHMSVEWRVLRKMNYLAEDPLLSLLGRFCWKEERTTQTSGSLMS